MTPRPPPEPGPDGVRAPAGPGDRRLATRLATWALRHAQVFFESLGRLSRTPFSTLMTAAVIGIALALPAGLHVILKNLQQLGGGLESAARISLFLKKDTSEAAARRMVRELSALPEVARVRYISRDEALAEFKRLSGFGAALDALAENPLPAVIVVTPALRQAPEAAARLLAKCKAYPAVDLAQLDQQWIQRLYALMDIAARGVQVLAVLLALGVVLVVGNTIRLAIQNRRDEIVIIKLIGGTDAFIRRPFLYAGFWYGLMGGAAAWLFIALALGALAGPVDQLAALYHSGFSLQGLGAEGAAVLMGLSVALGLAGSWLAVGRHLRAIEPR